MNVDVMDGLDWAIVVSAIGGYCLLIGHFFAGIDVLGVHDSPSWRIGPGVAVAFLLFFVAIDQVMPMKTIVYAVNGGPNPINIGVADTASCLPARSYTVLTWRTRVSRPLNALSASQSVDNSYPVGPGLWLINVSSSKVFAELIKSERISYAVGKSDVALAARGSVHIDIGGWRIARLDFDAPEDRAWSADGGITKQTGDRPCSAGLPAERPPR